MFLCTCGNATTYTKFVPSKPYVEVLRMCICSWFDYMNKKVITLSMQVIPLNIQVIRLYTLITGEIESCEMSLTQDN